MNCPSLAELKAFAHRTPMRYMRDDDCPYQFSEHNFINFARLIIDWRDEQLAKQEPVYQLKSGDGKWIDQAKHCYEYNLKNGHEIRKLYAAPMPAQAPEGWKLVPVEQTDEMLAAVGEYCIGDGGGCCPSPVIAKHECADVYRAMLAAAPVPPNAASADAKDAALKQAWDALEHMLINHPMAARHKCISDAITAIDAALKGGE